VSNADAPFLTRVSVGWLLPFATTDVDTRKCCERPGVPVRHTDYVDAVHGFMSVPGLAPMSGRAGCLQLAKRARSLSRVWAIPSPFFVGNPVSSSTLGAFAVE